MSISSRLHSRITVACALVVASLALASTSRAEVLPGGGNCPGQGGCLNFCPNAAAYCDLYDTETCDYLIQIQDCDHWWTDDPCDGDTDDHDDLTICVGVES